MTVIATEGDVPETGGFRNIGFRSDLSGEGALTFQALREGVPFTAFRGDGSGAPVQLELDGLIPLSSTPGISDDGRVFLFVRGGEGDVRQIVSVVDDRAPTTLVADDDLEPGVVLSGAFAVAPGAAMAFLVRRISDEAYGVGFVVDGEVQTSFDPTAALSPIASLANNDAGLLIFQVGSGFDEGSALRQGPTEEDRIIGPGDALFGGVVSGVSFAGGLNAASQFAFSYCLETSECGIARADPVPLRLGRRGSLQSGDTGPTAPQS